MPFINTRTNIRISAEKEASLKEKLGKAISEFPGKSEYWLMLNFSDNCNMWFRGYQNIPCAMVEVQLFGGADDDACNRMTAAICQLFHEELNISPEHVYVNYSFSQTWGWNGENF